MRLKSFIYALSGSLILSLSASHQGSACTNIIITKGASADGSNMISYAADATASKKSAQIGLFGMDPSVTKLKLTSCADWPYVERLENEKEALGFYLSAHPLDAYNAILERLRVVSSNDVADMVNLSGATRVSMAGIVSSVRERISQKTGKKFAFVTASDKYGPFDMMCFSETLMMNRDKLKSGQPLLLSISADKKPDDEQIRILCRLRNLLILSCLPGIELSSSSNFCW